MSPSDSKTRLLDATLLVVRAKGHAATRIEDICAEAGVTKGSFFHHFKSKDDLMMQAVAHWDAMTSGLFANHPYHAMADPLERLLAYLDLRKALLEGELREITCFVGTIAQEAYQTRPDIVRACGQNICKHAATLEADIEAAMAAHRVQGDWTARSLALHTQAVIQGAFVLVKATGDVAVAAQSIEHLQRYLKHLFLGGAASTI